MTIAKDFEIDIKNARHARHIELLIDAMARDCVDSVTCKLASPPQTMYFFRDGSALVIDLQWPHDQRPLTETIPPPPKDNLTTGYVGVMSKHRAYNDPCVIFYGTEIFLADNVETPLPRLGAQVMFRTEWINGSQYVTQLQEVK